MLLGARPPAAHRRVPALTCRAAAASPWPLRAAKQSFGSFAELLSAEPLPLLVDFYALWCGPCQMLAPELEAVGAELRGRLRVAKVDVDKYPAIASQYRIAALPCLVLFKGGQPVDRVEGLLTRDQLLARLRPLLSE